MIKRTQLVLLFMLVLSGVVLLGSNPALAEDTTNITGISVDGGKVVTSVSGQIPIDPCYNPTPEDPTNCQPMYVATVLEFCSENPDPEGNGVYDLTTCRRFVSSTFGTAYNKWVVIGGRLRYVAP
jgi:hypothetical protein